MTTDVFEYDVAVSFASEDRLLAEKFHNLFAQKNIKAFRDEYQRAEPDLWGKDIVDHLVNLYARKARYCMLLISEHYPLDTWTREDRTSARERALRDPDEYILLIQLDDREVPGITGAKGYRDLRRHSVESLVGWLDEKLREITIRAGPPRESHDLRSGNIPQQGQT